LVVTLGLAVLAIYEQTVGIEAVTDAHEVTEVAQFLQFLCGDECGSM
jgi:hypothetical protein